MSLQNMLDDEIKLEIEALELRKRIVQQETEAEGRQLTSVQSHYVRDIDKQVDYLRNELKMREPQRPLTLESWKAFRMGGFGSIQGPFPSFGDQLLSVARAQTPGGVVDPRLHQIQNAATGLNETTPGEGAFLIQQDFTNELIRAIIETSLLARRCMRVNITGNSNGTKLNAYDETSRASTRFGGVTGYWIDEASEINATKPKFRQMDLTLKKLCGLCYATDELLQDASVLESAITTAFVSEFGFLLDDAILNGSGAGQPLGIMQSGCLVTVDAETGQNSGTLVAENVLKMIERTLGPTTNYVWINSKSCLEQIYNMSLAVGTGGIPLFIAGGRFPDQPENRLLGLRLIECEQCQVLGPTGDIVLADLTNGYVLAQKGGIQADMSIHVRFNYAESVFRFIMRVDGQPMRATALTPAHGGSSYTQSYFVVLQTSS